MPTIKTKNCPFCSEKIKFDAQKCKHCGEWLRNAEKITKKKSIRNYFLLWFATLIIFFLDLYATNFNFIDDENPWLITILFLDIAFGIFFFSVLQKNIVVEFIRGIKKTAFLYFIASILTTISFFLSFGLIPANYEDVPRQSPSPDSMLRSRNSCEESKTLHAAKNCTLLIMRDDGGHGTGFSISPGYLITNKHVIENAKSLTTWINGEKPLTLWNYAPTLDIAILKLSENIPTCNWFDSSYLELAEPVFAIGWPEIAQGESTITRGVYSRLNKFEAGLEFIQTDAAINPGNSGGPLINVCGVVGMNTQKEVWSSSNIPLEGLGNALSSNSIRPVIDSLINSGSDDTEFPKTKKASKYANNQNDYSAPNSPIIDVNQIHSHLANIRAVKTSWEREKNNNKIPQDQLSALLDSLKRQIAFSDTLAGRLAQRKATQDDIIMWDAIVKMSYESAVLTAKLNTYFY